MVSVSLLAGPLHLTGETKRELAEEGLGKKTTKKTGWQIRKWTNEWCLFVCSEKMAHYVINVGVRAHVCVCNAACIWLWGSCPRGEAQLKPAWHQSSVLVPWLTGCANRKRTGRTHTRSCVCVGNATLCPSLSKPNSTWVCDANLPATLSQCRRGHRQRG